MNFKLPHILFAGLLAAVTLAGCRPSTGGPETAASPTVTATARANRGEPSPKFNLTAPDGSTVAFDPSDNPDNEAYLLLFWSYRWDPNVKTLLERASELHERLAPRGLVIIGISYDEEPAGLRKFLDQNPVPFDVAVGADSTYDKFQIESVPTGILVDAEGRIVERWTGYYTTEELSQTISPYIPGRSGNSEH